MVSISIYTDAILVYVRSGRSVSPNETMGVNQSKHDLLLSIITAVSRGLHWIYAVIFGPQRQLTFQNIFLSISSIVLYVCVVCCLRIKPLFLPNDIISKYTQCPS